MPHDETELTSGQRFWRNRRFARARHTLGRLPYASVATTRLHASLIRASGGRIRRSFLFTGGMPIMVLTTTGRKSGQQRATPVGFVRHGAGFAVLASNAGSDGLPAWWLNLQAEPRAHVLVDRKTVAVVARGASAEEDRDLWTRFARLNPGFDEYRHLTQRPIPVVLLEPAPS